MMEEWRNRNYDHYIKYHERLTYLPLFQQFFCLSPQKNLFKLFYPAKSFLKLRKFIVEQTDKHPQ